jgi:hypothetical protein
MTASLNGLPGSQRAQRSGEGISPRAGACMPTMAGVAPRWFIEMRNRQAKELRRFLGHSSAGRAIYAILGQAAFSVPTLQCGLGLRFRFRPSTVARAVLELRRLGALRAAGVRNGSIIWARVNILKMGRTNGKR